MWVVELAKTENVVGTHRDRDGAIRRAKKIHRRASQQA
jgi:hypothetical protein